MKTMWSHSPDADLRSMTLTAIKFSEQLWENWEQSWLSASRLTKNYTSQLAQEISSKITSWRA